MLAMLKGSANPLRHIRRMLCVNGYSELLPILPQQELAGMVSGHISVTALCQSLG